jgi:hypothetical protein
MGVLVKGIQMDEDCCNALNEAAEIIAKHLKEFYNNRAHKDETPTCIVCMAFFLGTQNADALRE